MCETVEKSEGRERAASEMADLLYHSMVLLNTQARPQDLSLGAWNFCQAVLVSLPEAVKSPRVRNTESYMQKAWSVPSQTCCISNKFIEQYTAASGTEFVGVYLTVLNLLRGGC